MLPWLMSKCFITLFSMLLWTLLKLRTNLPWLFPYPYSNPYPNCMVSTFLMTLPSHGQGALSEEKWATCCGTFSRTIYTNLECKICKLAYFYFFWLNERVTNQECTYNVALHYLPKNYNGSIAQSSRVSRLHTHYKGVYYNTSSHIYVLYFLLIFFFLVTCILW